ncbi:MAG: hypothetical protein Q4F23_00495 [Coriobacteriia bacterium]|nr:hypothetical protein [Coriobacteriia bacterium]
MAAIGYHGSYVRFKTQEQEKAVAFLGLDNAVGDHYEIRTKYEEGERTDWIVNAFDVEMGELDPKFADTLDLIRAKGWNVEAVLSFVAFQEARGDEPGYYWGEVAVVAWDSRYDKAFETFIDKLDKSLGDGIRPDIKLGSKALEALVDAQGDYLPSGRVPLPKKKKGMAFVKTERSANEKLAAQARKGNKGCLAASWIFVIALVCVIAYAIYRFSGVF